MGKVYKVGNPKVTIFGGSGFLGRYVAYVFAKNGWKVCVAVRFPNNAGFLRVYGVEGQISLMEVNIAKEEEVTRAISGSDAVVNCIGILEEAKGSQTFEKLHNKYATQIAIISKRLGVKRLTHISSLGVNESSLSGYSRSKAKGDNEIMANFPDSVVLRPSVIFGPEDQFFNRFARMCFFSPVIPIIGGTSRFQPIYVLDVATVVAKSVTDSSFKGIYELGGPEIFNFSDMISIMLKIIQRRRFIFELPFGAASFLATILSLLRTGSFNIIPSLITRDQVNQLRYDNVVGKKYGNIKSFDIQTSSLSIILPQYLWKYRKSGQFNDKGLGGTTN